MNYFSLDKKKDRGFSLIELVVVVGVLAVLSAIAIPSFICFPKRARATAALTALRQIKTECTLKEAEANQNLHPVIRFKRVDLIVVLVWCSA